MVLVIGNVFKCILLMQRLQILRWATVSVYELRTQTKDPKKNEEKQLTRKRKEEMELKWFGNYYDKQFSVSAGAHVHEMTNQFYMYLP